jgi:hypothetical protein
MSKVKNKTENYDTVSYKVPKIIEKKVYFSKLLANRHVNFRNKLYDKLDAAFGFAAKSNFTYKDWYLYPSRIRHVKGDNSKKLLNILEESLYITYLEQAEFINNSVEEIKKDYGTKEI